LRKTVNNTHKNLNLEKTDCKTCSQECAYETVQNYDTHYGTEPYR